MASIIIPKITDAYPEDMIKIKWIYKNIRNVLNSFGFHEVDPVWTESTLHENIIKMKGNIAAPKPQKLYSISKVCPKDSAGKKDIYESSRIASACIIGSKSHLADAEIIAVAAETLSLIGIYFKVRIGHRELISEIIGSLGVEDSDIDKVLEILKSSIEDGIQATLGKLYEIGIEEVAAKEMLNIIKYEGSPKEAIKNIKNNFDENDSISMLAENLGLLIDELDNYNLYGICEINLSVVGAPQNDGIVFEIYDLKSRAGPLLYGGRADGLSKMLLNDDIPSTCINANIDMIKYSVEKNSILNDIDASPDIYIAPSENKIRRKAIIIAKKLREKHSVEIDVTGTRPVAKQLEHAHKSGIKNVVIVNDADIKKGFVVLKNIKTGAETKIVLKKKK